MRAILTDKKKVALFWSWSASRFETGLEYYICNLQFVIIFILFSVVKLCLNLPITAQVQCWPSSTVAPISRVPSMPLLFSSQSHETERGTCGGPVMLCRPGDACFAPSSFLPLLSGDSLFHRLHSTSVGGCSTGQTTHETVRMQSWRPGLRGWWAVMPWCMALGGDGHWGGHWSVGRGYTGGRNLRGMRLCDIVHRRKS